MTTLSIEDLVVVRGGRAVIHGVSLEVPAGQITGLLGPNGAGKSSLALAISGLLRPSKGNIRLGDRQLGGMRPDRVRARGVAVVPEGRRLLPSLSVCDNLVTATYSRTKSDSVAAHERALELFPELRKRWGQPAKALSGGEQQMLVLAMALASDPAILVIDELSLGLAPIVVARLVPTLRRVADEGIGVLLIEQFAHLVLGLSTNVHILERGRIRYQGTAAALRAEPDILHSAYLLGRTGNGSDGKGSGSVDGST